VLDTQAGKNREIEADMFRGFLSGEVSIMVFVTKSRENAKNVDRISIILAENLSGYGVSDESMPITIALIIPETVRNAEGALRYLNNIRSKLISPL